MLHPAASDLNQTARQWHQLWTTITVGSQPISKISRAWFRIPNSWLVPFSEKGVLFSGANGTRQFIMSSRRGLPVMI